jgi:hypothetical protein
MNKLKTTKQIFALMMVLAIAVIFSYVLFFNNIKEKNKTISLITNDVNIAVQRDIKLRSAKDLIKDTQESRSELDTYFVIDDKLVDFIEDVERISRYTGADVEVMSVNVDDNKNAENDISELLKLNFEAKGEWKEVFQFLALIEKMPFKIDVSTASFRVIHSDDIEEDSPRIWKGFFSISTIKLK